MRWETLEYAERILEDMVARTIARRGDDGSGCSADAGDASGNDKNNKGKTDEPCPISASRVTTSTTAVSDGEKQLSICILLNFYDVQVGKTKGGGGDDDDDDDGEKCGPHEHEEGSKQRDSNETKLEQFIPNTD